MLEITRIRAEKDAIIEGLKKRAVDYSKEIEAIIAADEQWRVVKTELESIQAESNQISKEIGLLFKQGKVAEANKAKERTTVLKEKEQVLRESVAEWEHKITDFLYQVPNVPISTVPAGKSEADNEVVEEVGFKVTFTGEALPHGSWPKNTT